MLWQASESRAHYSQMQRFIDYIHSQYPLSARDYSALHAFSAVSYKHLLAHETVLANVFSLLLDKTKKRKRSKQTSIETPIVPLT